MVGHWFESGLLLANVRLQDNEEDKWDKKQGLSVHIFMRPVSTAASQVTHLNRLQLDEESWTL